MGHRGRGNPLLRKDINRGWKRDHGKLPSSATENTNLQTFVEIVQQYSEERKESSTGKPISQTPIYSINLESPSGNTTCYVQNPERGGTRSAISHLVPEN